MSTNSPSRRQALRLAGSAGVAAGVAIAATSAPAAAGVSYRPGRYPATRLLDVPARHLVNRFSYGITPQLADEVRAAGGRLAWFDRQLAAAYDGSADDLWSPYGTLELHTVGIGNYTETDVKDAARILTGWRLDLFRTWAPFYSTADHWIGPVKVMGFADQNARADGRDLTQRLLSYLAHHPATARRVATKLVQAFVSDEVPAGLVDRLSATYLAHDTAIQPMLRELVRSPEFAAAVDKRLRDADEDVLATYRLLGVTVRSPTGDSSAANQTYWQVASLGLAPWTWPRPDGQPIDSSAWASPTRALASMSLHWSMAGGWWPKVDAAHRAPVSWLPQRSLVFRDFVDHLSRLLLHRPSTAVLLRSCCEATELAPAARISARSDLFTWRWPRLAAAILDSPAFYQH